MDVPVEVGKLLILILKDSGHQVGLVSALGGDQLHAVVGKQQAALVAAQAYGLLVGLVQCPGNFEGNRHAVFKTDITVGEFLNIEFLPVKLSGG